MDRAPITCSPLRHAWITWFAEGWMFCADKEGDLIPRSLRIGNMAHLFFRDPGRFVSPPRSSPLRMQNIDLESKIRRP